MEEVIKKLESYLNGDKIYDTELDNALRNLIVRYKELEELLEEKTLRIGFENKDNYIPKSKVKEILNKLSNHNYKCNFDDVDFLQNIIIEIHQLLED